MFFQSIICPLTARPSKTVSFVWSSQVTLWLIYIDIGNNWLYWVWNVTIYWKLPGSSEFYNAYRLKFPLLICWFHFPNSLSSPFCLTSVSRNASVFNALYPSTDTIYSSFVLHYRKRNNWMEVLCVKCIIIRTISFEMI